MMYKSILFLFIAAIVLLSCDKSEVEPVNSFNVDSVIVAWLDSSNITATRDDAGYYYYIDTSNPAGNQVGSGQQVVAVYYTLFDLDSTILASRQPSDGDSLLFKSNVNAVFPIGLDLGIDRMRVGETYNFVLPPSLAYGGVSGIETPDNTGVVRLNVSLVGILEEQAVFTEELNQIEEYIMLNSINDTTSITIERIDTTFMGTTIISIDTTFAYQIDSANYLSSGVRYKTEVAGTGTVPVSGENITVNYTGTFLDDEVFQTRTGFQFEFEGGVPNDLIPGVNQAIVLMSVGERGIILMPSSQAYRESVFVVPAGISNELVSLQVIPDYAAIVPPYSSLVFNITRTN